MSLYQKAALSVYSVDKAAWFSGLAAAHSCCFLVYAQSLRPFPSQGRASVLPIHILLEDGTIARGKILIVLLHFLSIAVISIVSIGMLSKSDADTLIDKMKALGYEATLTIIS